MIADAITALVPLAAPRLFHRTRDNFARVLNISCDQPRVFRLARASVRNFGRMAIDFLWTRTLSDPEIEVVTTLSHEDRLWEALSPRRGVILVLPHLGCWDVAAARASAARLGIAIVTEGTWQAALASASRSRSGVTLVPRDGSLRPLLEALRQNKGVVLLSDVARPGVQTCEVTFFGSAAQLPSGPARLSARTGAPVVVVACVRTAECQYRVDFRPTIWPEATAADRHTAVTTITAQIAREFEALIRAHPDQWYPFGHIWSGK